MRKWRGGNHTSKNKSFFSKKSVKQSPRRSAKQSPRRSAKQSPRRSAKKSPRRSAKKSIEKSIRSSLYSTNALDAITASRNREKKRKGYEQLLQAAKYIKNQSNPIKGD